MLIRKFEKKDIPAVNQMIQTFWGNETEANSEEFQEFVQEYMHRYHKVNHNYSLCLENKAPQAFILASLPSDDIDIDLWCQERIKNFNTKEQRLALEYRHYFERNSKIVKQYMGKQDLLVHLFMSQIKGGGTMLLDELVETCRRQSLKSLYLWTDTTCNYEYYEYNGFAKMDSWNCVTEIYNPKEVEIMVYKKEIDLFPDNVA